MARVYFQYFDFPFLGPRLCLYMLTNVFGIYLIYKIVKDLRMRKEHFDIDTQQSYSMILSLLLLLISANVCSLVVFEYLTELLLIITIFAILDSVYRVLIFYKRSRYKIKYR